MEPAPTQTVNDLEVALQDRHAPRCICFGCGPANARGLRIKSHRRPDEPYLKVGRGLVCQFQPAHHHQAWTGTLNGGILGALLDCHGNWTAAIAHMDTRGLEELPSTVTASYGVKLLRPTPYGPPLHLTSKVAAIEGPKVVVELALSAEDHLTVTGKGTFVAVEKGHPAYHRWE